nr:MAG TPA: hypothetical protein [Caudoviricetes sp.]
MRRPHWPPVNRRLRDVSHVAVGHLSLAQSPKPPANSLDVLSALRVVAVSPLPPSFPRRQENGVIPPGVALDAIAIYN